LDEITWVCKIIDVAMVNDISSKIKFKTSKCPIEYSTFKYFPFPKNHTTTLNSLKIRSLEPSSAIFNRQISKNSSLAYLFFVPKMHS
jgi:hypothetical protein